MELYEKVYVKPSFLETEHGQIGCEDCHGGDPSDPDWKTAHEGLIKDPTDTDPEAVCGECHEAIVASAGQSLHVTLAPIYGAVAQRAGGADKAAGTLAQACKRHCGTCHASCGQCHVSRPDYVQGGFLAKHHFIKPAMDTTCASCHGGRVHSEYTGARDDFEADVHYESEEMTCMDCHDGSQMHAATPGGVDRFDMPQRPDCRNCHQNAVSETTENRSHRLHRNRVACQVCHAQAGKSCFSCHVGTDAKGLPYFKCKKTEPFFKIGHNPRKTKDRPYAFVVLRHPPTVPDTFKYYTKKPLAQFDALPTWKLDTPHSILRITARNKTCNNCHGNAALFLSDTDLEKWEHRANADVVVPADEIPKPVDDAQNPKP